MQKDNTPKDIMAKIWMRERLFDLPALRIQICGAAIVKSVPIEIAWIEEGMPAISTCMKCAKDNFFHRCYDSVNTNSNDLLIWANELVQNCSKEHELCQNKFVPLPQKSYLPLRLVGVQDAEGATGVVRLVSTAELEPDHHISYCALSHCWGGQLKVQLTKDNIHAMESIQMDRLPRNFQDAVAVTRKLGCRYLWIDSLNIVQDDAEELKLESTKMGLVYANAQCVISATASKDPAGGCFRIRALNYNPCVLRVSENKLLVAQPSQVPKLTDLFTSLVQQAPLSTRGWTFQERYLAGRTLHFCQGFVLFECNTLTASEHNRHGQEYPSKPSIRSDGKLHSQHDITEVERYRSEWIPNPPSQQLSRYNRTAWQTWLGKRRINPLYRDQQRKRAAMLKASARTGVCGAFEFLWHFKGEALVEKSEFHQSWFEIVQVYSVRKLTYDTDKAIAIAGFAYFIQQNTGLRYAAGLWLDMLPFNLLWFALGNACVRPVRSVPSWSWISVDGEISHRLMINRWKLNDKEAFRCPWAKVDPLISDTH